MSGGKAKGWFTDRFAALPVPVMESPAWRWLPAFSRTVTLFVAAQWTPYTSASARVPLSNNGGLEARAVEAERFGIRPRELWAGLGLAMHAGLLLRTVRARGRSGRGSPAKYALTWLPLGSFPGLNITAGPATHDYLRFVVPPTVPRSVNAAEKFLRGLAGDSSVQTLADDQCEGSHRIAKLRCNGSHQIAPSSVQGFALPLEISPRALTAACLAGGMPKLRQPVRLRLVRS